jgi:CheY-like chemotaxis protein
MPKLGGFEVMEEMKKDKELQDIPVIIISNSGQPVELERAKNLGAKDWVIKTDFDPQEVIIKVKKILT